MSITTELLIEIDRLREENYDLREDNEDLRKQLDMQIDDRVKDAQALTGSIFKAILSGRLR